MEKSQEKFKNFKSSRLYEFFYNNRYVVLSFLCSAAVMIVVYLSYGIIPFGEHTVLRMDLYHQYGPLFAELYDRLTGFDSLIYSWTTGGGGSFLGAFYNYLSSPLSIFILAFGHIGNPESISFLILIKAALASAAFTYYLKKSDEFSKHNATTAAFGVLYAFCGFFIAYYWNVMWLDAMYMLPLVVLGIERIINKGKPMLYSISLAITLFANFYLGFMVCIFCLLYAVMYYFGKYSIKSKFVPLENGQKQNVISALKNSRLLTSVFKFIGSSFLAILLCAVSLLPVFYILQFSSATSGNFPQEMSSYFKIFDFLANHLASLDPTIR
ncbi:MAG: YfhO family protein, partial [Oscillospiraceae bacterium]|nr:YfhO family protein [Oscillospiraceae bacterium]